MMKRVGGLLPQIITYENLRLAWLKALRGKRKSNAVLLFSRNVDANIEKIKIRLESDNPDWGNYRSFTITDPKERIISAAPFPERVMHHAIMNVLEPCFERQLIHHTYACRKGKGTHAAVLYAFHKAKGHSWFLKLDVRKYFDSIDHQVLKCQISRLLKDPQLLNHLFLLIDSYHTLPGIGLPIGNLTSQYFANLYLSGLDHFILEQLGPSGYVRYMDDFVLWSDNKADLVAIFQKVEAFCLQNLKLNLKPAILGQSKDGLPFLGFLIKSQGIYLLQKSKQRMKKGAIAIEYELANGQIDENKAAERSISMTAAVLLARCRSFRAKLWHGSRFGHEPRQTRWQLEQQCD